MAVVVPISVITFTFAQFVTSALLYAILLLTGSAAFCCSLYWGLTVLGVRYARWSDPAKIALLAAIVTTFWLSVHSIYGRVAAGRSGNRGGLIAGTSVTYEKLTQLYPFGWIVYALNEATTSYEPLVYDKLVWDASWKDVVFIPDFAHNKATVALPPNITFKVQGRSYMRFENILNVTDIDMDGSVYRSLIDGGPNQPCLHLSALSNNQRKPVFVIGFRIAAMPSK